MPQLDFTTWPNQIFWLLVTLVAIYFMLTRVALPRISAVLAERRGTITNDLAAAEELKQKGADAEKAYNDALATARVEAAQDRGRSQVRTFRQIWIRRLPRLMPRLPPKLPISEQADC